MEVVLHSQLSKRVETLPLQDFPGGVPSQPVAGQVRFNAICVVLALVALILTGCGPDAKTSRQAKATMRYSERELSSLIRPGMSVNEVSNTVGRPGSLTQVGDGVARLMYSYPIPPPGTRDEIAGFVIYVTNGSVMHWDPIKGSSDSERAFHLYIVRDNLTNTASAVATQGSTDATQITNVPDLSFSAKVFSDRRGAEAPGQDNAILVLSETDAAKLRALSEQHIGSQLLFVTDGKAVAASYLVAPLTSRQVMLRVKPGDL